MELVVTSLARTALAEFIADLRVVEAPYAAGDVALLNLGLVRRDERTSSGAGSGAGFRETGVSPARWNSNPGYVSLRSVLLRGLSHRVPEGQRGDWGSNLMAARASEGEVMVGFRGNLVFREGD